MTDPDELRREGMAEAVVRIVLSRRFPTTVADSWCEILGLQRSEIKAAMQRMKDQGVRLPSLARPTTTPRAARPQYAACPEGCTCSKHRKRDLMRECPYCAKSVMKGVHWQNHMAALHAEEWGAYLEAELEKKYGPKCPDCGERIKITVHVERHTCCATGEIAA